MKPVNFLFVLFFLFSLILASCAEQSALTKENQLKGLETNVNAMFLEKQETEADVTVKHKILIAPFEYKAKGGAYPNPEIYKTIFFTSFYNLFSVLPSIDLPDKSVLLNMNPSEDTIPVLAKQYQCDFIVFGDYSLKGPKLKPDAVVNLKIWNKFSGSIMTNSLTTPTEAELFDAIDTLLSRMVRTMLNEEMKIAYLNFNNIDTGKEKLGIFINHRLVAEPVSNNFQLNMKIISGKDYKVSIRRFLDGKLLTGAVANLKPGESMNFSATNYRINLIKNAGFNEDTFKKGTWTHSDGLNLSIENGVCHIKFKYSGAGNTWDHQLIAFPVKIEAGKRYRVSFDARASEGENIYAKMDKSNRNGTSDDALSYWGSPLGTGSGGEGAPKKISVDKVMKNYIFVFRMVQHTDTKAQLEFDLGNSYGDIWLSDVMVEELD